MPPDIAGDALLPINQKDPDTSPGMPALRGPTRAGSRLGGRGGRGRPSSPLAALPGAPTALLSRQAGLGDSQLPRPTLAAHPTRSSRCKGPGVCGPSAAPGQPARASVLGRRAHRAARAPVCGVRAPVAFFCLLRRRRGETEAKGQGVTVGACFPFPALQKKPSGPRRLRS